ncbi:prolyl oligopeptidase family serine peptidase [Maribacter sp. BPC-D8]|uniref:prolyl oligopeptidase family serine peptidase n=1 Tax=Maribacter sp. BPC-D8 TaxID=3053613 RepID=UPI002B476A0B|nr:prolyl oligopeptidase family serine peptidase [Maribacter sp. BPC-D8]WRI30596.1 prolyl oligopeptidase family serine peptidase [Maribacter sp. BPC-D8]
MIANLYRNFLLIVFLFITITSFSQTTVMGTVVDKKDATALPYAYLKIDDIALGTVTDGDGRFRIIIPEKYTNYNITLGYVGYKDLHLTIKDFIAKDGGVFAMESTNLELMEVVVTPKKMPSAKALLRKVIKNIPANYAESTTKITGYYRETLKENGVYIKYSDAVCDYYAEPYSNKNYKWKEYQNPSDYSFSNGSFNFYSNSLHRVHFHHRTLKNEQVAIINSRSSSNLSNRDFEANIEGGPLGLFARNRVKYQQSFLGNKANRDFTFKVSEEEDADGTWLYVLDFETKTTKEALDAVANPSNNRQWRLANKNKLLKGRIYIDQDDFAVVRYECAVPNLLKQYFCSYEEMAVKHFDYKLDVSYKKKGNQYYLDKMRHEDEFIYKDTTDITTTYYSAISEFNVSNINEKNTTKISKEDNFANTVANQLYEFPLEYDSIFWQEYTAKNPISTIKSTIREDMELDKSLERQFHDKHVRNDSMPEPIAKIEPSIFKIHGENYTDNYAWLKDTKAPISNKPVMDYLRKENKYTENYNIPLKKTQRSIYLDLVKSIEENSTSLRTKKNGYFYYSKYSEDDEYPVYYRKSVENDPIEEELLNLNELAKDKGYYNAGVGSASPNNQLIAVYENTTGKDEYVLKVKDLTHQTFLADSINRVGTMVWLDNASFLYANVEDGTYRSSKILRHVLGTDSTNDLIVYEESDPSFNVSIEKSRSKDYIFLNTGSSTSSENWYLKTDNPNGQFKVIHPREKNHVYHTTDYNNKFYILTNENALNYKIVTAEVNDASKSKWKVLIPHQAGVLIEYFQLFDDYMVITEKENAQSRIKIINRATQENHFMKFDEEFYNIGIGYNPNVKTDSLQFSYSSFETPYTTYNYNMKTKEKSLVKQHSKPIKHPFYKYKIERKWVTAKDGKKIPLTLISNNWRARRNNAKHKVYLTSYGAYGMGQELVGGPTAHHMVNNDYLYAIAHVRGGDDLGREWYEDGKLFNKKNSFSDFIACAEYLIEEDYAQEGHIVADGASAGGLLMGGVVNERPELFNTVILNVPFVDVINTMLDENLPLTVGEFDEWGNPKNKKEYEYIKSYSPYDNVKAQNYPNMLFFTGLNDTRVGYWEPAKMVAKLRATKTDDNVLLLKTDFSNGHSGGSGRFAGFRDSAYKLALIYDLNTIPKDTP